MNTTRKGKIARLPKDVRESLNRRLADGESGKSLVRWLNSLEEVKAVLDREFDGRPVLEQNLSEWKTGGFKEWEDNQNTLELVRDLTERAVEVQVASGAALSDALSRLVGVRWAKRLAILIAKGDDDSPEVLAEWRELSVHLDALRRSDHTAERLRLERAWLELEEKKLREQTEADHMEWANQNLDRICKCYKTPEQRSAKMGALRFALFGNQGNPTIPDLPPHNQDGVFKPNAEKLSAHTEAPKMGDEAADEMIHSDEVKTLPAVADAAEKAAVTDAKQTTTTAPSSFQSKPKMQHREQPNPAKSKQIKPNHKRRSSKLVAVRRDQLPSRVSSKGKGYCLSDSPRLMS